MTVQDWGAIGELVGSLAILVTLVYLAVQVKQARRATEDQNRDRRVQAVRDINSRLVTCPDVRQAFDKTCGEEWKEMVQRLAATWEVSVDEASTVLWSQSDYLWTHWAQYRSIKSKADETELRNIIATWYSAPPMSTIIREPVVRALYESDFIAWVDEILAARLETDA